MIRATTMPVEGLDGFVQPLLCILALLWRQGIVYPIWPTFLFKGRKNHLLIGGWNTKTLHHLSADD